MMKFNPWLDETKVDHNTMQLGAYAVYLWQFGMNRSNKGNTYSTICGKLCAIRWYHRSTAGYDPGVNASHAILLRGIRRFTNPVTKQQPLTAQMLRVIFEDLDLSIPRNQLLWGGLLLGYFFLLRRSEYLFIGNKVHSYILRLSAIQFTDRDCRPTTPRKAVMVGITLHGAKNNQYGREEVRYHHLSGDKLLCPVRAARWIRRGASAFKTTEGAPALAMSQGGITADNVATTIRRAAVKMGLDPNRFSTHSVRIGGATALLNAGTDRLLIKLMGRWLSNAFEAYPVLNADGSAGMSRRMC